MAPPTQQTRQIAVHTPLGEDVLLLSSFSGHEEMSRLFTYNLDMISPRDTIAAADIVGKNVTFEVRKAGDQPRYFNGFVSRFTALDREAGMRRYAAEVVPWLWFLTRAADCRIFQHKSIPDVIKQVFQDRGFTDFETSELKGNYEPWEYCVQYRESDFNFVSRLMEQEGIFYYFRHENGKHTLVLADQMGACKDVPEKEVEYEYSYSSEVRHDRVTSWAHGYEFVSGKWAETDYNFEKFPPRSEPTPANLLMTKEKSKVNLPNIDKYEIYDYPGEYELKPEGQQYTKVRMEEEEVRHDVAHGGSTCRTFTVGGKFTFKKHDCQSEVGKTYAITAIEHSAHEPTGYGVSRDAGFDYSNSFTCIPAAVSFRPARITPKPIVQGSQTAVVVGPPGEEIWPDQYGRVKVQFHWDRVEKRKDKSSCWIRCMQTMAGKNWGAIYIPRIGQEVVVSYLEGDPDRPLISGLVYNADQMPPYTLPDEKTKSYIKTNSSKGGNGYNELRFEDKAGKEQIFIHAQQNINTRVNANSMESIGANRHLTVGGEKDGKKSGDQKEMVYQDKQLKVHRNQSELIGGNMELLIGGIDGGEGNLDVVLKGTQKELIEKDDHLHVKGKRCEKIDGDQSLTVGGSQQEKVGKKHALDVGQEVHIKCGQKVIIEAGAQLTIKGPGGFVDIGPSGVTIQGTMVLINSGGAAGSGSGSSPTAPEDAKEAAPAAPTPADSHKTGQKSAPW